MPGSTTLESLTREYQILLELSRANPEDEDLEQMVAEAWKAMEISWCNTSVQGDA